MNDTRAGRGILERLARRGILVTGVIVEAPCELRYCYRAATPMGRLAETPLAMARSVWRSIRVHRLLASRLDRGTRRLRTARRNSGDARRFVAELETDVLVLAGVGLVGNDLLEIPRVGTLNAHPGLVPWVRGNGAVCNAVLRGVAIGATCHWVDAGIDTGRVISRRLLPVAAGDVLEALEERAVELSTDLLAEVVANAVEKRSLPEGVVQDKRYPLGRWQDAQGRTSAAEMITAGRALELYARWKRLCRDADTDELLDMIPPESVPPVAVAPVRRAPLQSSLEP